MDTNKHTISHPCEISFTSLNIPPEYKQNCIDKIYELGDNQNKQTSVKAIMTSYLIWEYTDIFNPLIANINHKLNELFPIPPLKNSQYMLTDCWGAVYKKGHSTSLHNHGSNTFSFVYYLKANSNSAPLEFPLSHYKFQPQDDKLIIFPSFLPHSVPIQTDENDRICLVGNFKEINTIKPKE